MEVPPETVEHCGERTLRKTREGIQRKSMFVTWWKVPISYVDIMNMGSTPAYPVSAGLKGTEVNTWEENPEYDI